MTTTRRRACAALAGLVLAPAFAKEAAFRTIGWDDLLPKDWDPWAEFRRGELQGLDPSRLSDDDPRAAAALQRLRRLWDDAPLNPAMDGQAIRVPGYVVPLEETAQGLRELLLVPHYGACIHTPPPPSNQIIHVRLDKPSKSLSTMDTVWISGRLKLARATTTHGVSGYAGWAAGGALRRGRAALAKTARTNRVSGNSTRVYITGVSAGAAFTNRVIVEYPQLFAAAAPCYSGYFGAAIYQNYQSYPQIRTDVPMPIWQCRGGTEPNNSFPGGLAGQEAGRHFWRVVVNGHAAATTEDEALPTRTATLGPERRKHVKYFTGGKAQYVWQTTDHTPHFWAPEQADLMWRELFSRYQRNADGSLTYTAP